MSKKHAKRDKQVQNTIKIRIVVIFAIGWNIKNLGVYVKMDTIFMKKKFLITTV